jgi:hypothetical protein
VMIMNPATHQNVHVGIHTGGSHRGTVCACGGDMFMGSSSPMDLSVESEEVIYTGWGTVVLVPTGSDNIHYGVFGSRHNPSLTLWAILRFGHPLQREIYCPGDTQAGQGDFQRNQGSLVVHLPYIVGTHRW